jgi:N-methylhydantoinase B
MQAHMTNTRNTPVEALEHAYPLRVRETAIRRGSGGRGRWRGGDGIVRTLELLAPARVTVISDRRARGPYGLSGGEAGKPGVNRVTPPRDRDGGGRKNRRVGSGARRVLPSKFQIDLEAGSLVTVGEPGRRRLRASAAANHEPIEFAIRGKRGAISSTYI